MLNKYEVMVENKDSWRLTIEAYSKQEAEEVAQSWTDGKGDEHKIVYTEVICIKKSVSEAKLAKNRWEVWMPISAHFSNHPFDWINMFNACTKKEVQEWLRNNLEEYENNSEAYDAAFIREVKD